MDCREYLNYYIVTTKSLRNIVDWATTLCPICNSDLTKIVKPRNAHVGGRNGWCGGCSVRPNPNIQCEYETTDWLHITCIKCEFYKCRECDTMISEGETCEECDSHPCTGCGDEIKHGKICNFCLQMARLETRPLYHGALVKRQMVRFNNVKLRKIAKNKGLQNYMAMSRTKLMKLLAPIVKEVDLQVEYGTDDDYLFMTDNEKLAQIRSYYNNYYREDLQKYARYYGFSDWKKMKKAELVEELVKLHKNELSNKCFRDKKLGVGVEYHM